MITLKNERLELLIAKKGAEIRAVKFDGNDVFWSGDEKVWQGVSPVLFPMCGGLKDDKFVYGGKEYNLAKHGFAREMEFEEEKSGYNFVTLLLKSNENTLKSYPWEFEFRVTYKLIGKNIEVNYQVKNLSDKTMYFSVGSHEAYACPEGIEDYDIIFDKKETLDAYELDGNLLKHQTYPIIKDTNVLPLYEKYFDIDALVFKDVKSRSVSLRNRKTGREISVDFKGCDYLLIWTKNVPEERKYICIEPWGGIPAFVDDGYEIEKKEGVDSLEPSGEFSRKHTIHF